MLLDTTKKPLMFIRLRNTDKKILEEASELYQGLFVGANIPQYMTDFVRDLSKPFIVDPMTYIFILRPKQLLDKIKGTLRPSINSLCHQYGTLYQQAAGKRKINPDDLLLNHKEIESITLKVLQYQKMKFEGQLPLFKSYYDKYTLWEDGNNYPELAALPEVLIPPYFPFKDPDDLWYLVNLECNKLALSLKENDDHIFPILLINPVILEDLDIVKRIVDDFASQEFDGFFIWINEFKEDKEKPERLIGLIELIKGLSSKNRPVFKFYSGYFSVLLFAYGLKGFSCGLGYGSDKNVFAYGAGSGKNYPKYYIPRLHRSLQFGDAERLLRYDPGLRCDCKICSEVYGDDINKFPDMKKRGYSESHFLNVRKKEIKGIAEKGLQKVFSEIEDTIQEFDRDLLVNIESLKLWRKVLES